MSDQAPVYTERYMTPLNIYLESASDDDEIGSAMEEYGNCIKQLAAANIFPGDMPLKNFGVTRHGRVVFYDYDEIATLTDRLQFPQDSSGAHRSRKRCSPAPGTRWPPMMSSRRSFACSFSGNTKAQEDV